jgi:pimeloyl-ACP methyl ester carboxylesterase
MAIGRSVCFALLAALVAAPMAAAAQRTAAPRSAPGLVPAEGVDAWTIYGTPGRPKRDDGVVGAGSVVAPPRAAPADPWTSGAVVPIPQALAAGQRFTFAFWAKAAADETIPLSFQAREAPYPGFFSDSIRLTPRWQLFVRSALAPAALAAGTQAVTLQLGQARSAVTLGPVAMLDGPADPARIDAVFRAFHPNRVAEAVSIPSDAGVTLAGTLRTPVGRGPGPFPLAICIQGHGPNGRGGFDVLMNRLLADGIATFDYDKRGIGQSTGAYSEDSDALIRDARAAVAVMRRRTDIDASRIALVGHSQGGMIAPAVAAADPKIAAVVSFAGPVGDGLGLFRRSMHDELILSGREEAKVKPLVEAAVALLQARIDHADAGATKPLEAAVIDGFLANGFTREQAAGAMAAVTTDEVAAISRVHVASDLRSLHVPVLALFGSLDPLVRAQGNAAAARAALAQNPAGKVVIFDGLSHWFKEGAKTGSEAENATLGPNIGSPRAVAVAGDWLRDVLTPAAVRRNVQR